jgi:hypothetical protein
VNKYLKPLIFIATFIAAVAVFLVYSFFSNSHNTVIWNVLSVFPRQQYSLEKNDPPSVLEGNTIMIVKYRASFSVPDDWLEMKQTPDDHKKNLFFSRQDLNELDKIDHEINGQDSDEAEVISAVLPFSECVAHVGDKGWGNYLWSDLRGRVYITDLSPDEITAAVENKGLSKAEKLFTSVKLMAPGKNGPWKKTSLDIIDFPQWSDFMLGERLDFYARTFDQKTVVFVFLHTDHYEDEINFLLNSFDWRDESGH